MSCVFCDFSKIEKRTIATIEGFHITISLGQITNGGYLLIIPKKHTSCLGALTKAQATHLDHLTNQVIFSLEDEYQQSITFFEHGIVGQTINHAHLHIFPAKVNLKDQILKDFPDSKIEAIEDFSEFRKRYRYSRFPYLLWSTPKNETLVCWNPPAKPEYLRLVAANLLNVPERGSWKNMDPKLDEKLANETKLKLAPIFVP